MKLTILFFLCISSTAIFAADFKTAVLEACNNIQNAEPAELANWNIAVLDAVKWWNN